LHELALLLDLRPERKRERERERERERDTERYRERERERGQREREREVACPSATGAPAADPHRPPDLGASSSIVRSSGSRSSGSRSSGSRSSESISGVSGVTRRMRSEPGEEPREHGLLEGGSRIAGSRELTSVGSIEWRRRRGRRRTRRRRRRPRMRRGVRALEPASHDRRGRDRARGLLALGGSSLIARIGLPATRE
jgi:hypothetical protein